jgi:hypothetical protein
VFKKYHLITQIYDWCEENLAGNWFRDENILMYGIYDPYLSYIYIFEEKDAMLFKLAWG